MLKDFVEYGVLGILIFLSVIVFALILERIFVYKKIDILAFVDKKMLEIELTRNLTLLATIGTNAPYIGLLGTIGGIMLTFLEISQSESAISTGAIMSGLALALKATALGLIVAIPAIVGYNLLVRKCEVLLAKWDLEAEMRDSAKNAESNKMDCHDFVSQMQGLQTSLAMTKKGTRDSANQMKIAESNAKNTHPLTPSAREGGQIADSAKNARDSAPQMEQK